ncbi:MAG: VWA domain-containing protein [Candidatus Bathyarchaeota archaeon]|nr:MAG: VWA domain-containing protein [Candidatus Bathyarchaeota archaeon]
MGFYGYAENYSLKKDSLQIKILIDPSLTYPTLTWVDESPKFRVPEPQFWEEAIGFLGYQFPDDDEGKIKICRLFRAMVVHITAHTVYPLPRFLDSTSLSAQFVESIIKDLYVNEKIEASHPERIVDLAYANALATASFKRLNRIFLRSTRIMTAILMGVFCGRSFDDLDDDDRAIVEEITGGLSELKTVIGQSIEKGGFDHDEIREKAELLHERLREHGPFVEIPNFSYTENASSSSVYSNHLALDDTEVEPFFRDAMQALGGKQPEEGPISSSWEKTDEIESIQVFSNYRLEKAKEAKILDKLRESLEPTRFKSIEVPPQDHSEYIRTRRLIGGSSRRLLNNIMVATNLEFEDIRKKFGVLNLADAIQVVASKSDRSDVFMKDELLRQSFSLVVLMDVSRSMGVSIKESRARAVCLTDAVTTFITESASCALYAFSDRLYVLKDGSEPFTKVVRARIGGVPFDGATYMPEAIRAAAEFLKDKAEEQKIILILSDGFPYGYSEIHDALGEVTEEYEGKGVIIIGIGMDTEKMGELFRYSSAVYSQKDLINGVAKIFLKASMAELG